MLFDLGAVQRSSVGEVFQKSGGVLEVPEEEEEEEEGALQSSFVVPSLVNGGEAVARRWQIAVRRLMSGQKLSCL
ncbi:hypothetical protein Baya_14504 [Bagarius yarrelli]|uniref:Uncharacterized protein n=1 Tax=Bagarius yarrelli TaxID=175774 RepID=A0A556V913_BAGYA|nr:hypothetical protein Baya_14504 [Bagarius yarrelli]